MESLGNYAAQLVGLALTPLALCVSLLPTGEVAQSSTSEPEINSASEYTNISSFRTQPIGSRHAIRGAIPMLIAGFFATLGQRVQILILQYMPEKFNISFSGSTAGFAIYSVCGLFRDCRKRADYNGQNAAIWPFYPSHGWQNTFTIKMVHHMSLEMGQAVAQYSQAPRRLIKPFLEPSRPASRAPVAHDLSIPPTSRPT
ncbi:hypothetical protein BHYA_0036g00050 [Botrytis hyacinthi]|uniref:Uncharacterized protein n=1 Tax=Botrytis hyacinthi TaxID=278943 RepID=A0A4Z1GYD3_9HELO|nr:hypothetical protein BHYA_0036g00050 [Botrytis hyacinthi]